VTSQDVLARLLTTLERDGPVCGLMREAFVPGLLAGLGGVAWQLLRAHPESRLPSILTLGGSGF
jgi:lantibiotic modifying enzyme